MYEMNFKPEDLKIGDWVIFDQEPTFIKNIVKDDESEDESILFEFEDERYDRVYLEDEECIFKPWTPTPGDWVWISYRRENQKPEPRLGKVEAIHNNVYSERTEYKVSLYSGNVVFMPIKDLSPFVGTLPKEAIW